MHHYKKATPALACAAALLLASSTAWAEKDAGQEAAAEYAAHAEQLAEQGLSDAEIGAAMRVINQAQMEAARLALSRSEDAEVQQHARQVFEDHAQHEQLVSRATEGTAEEREDVALAAELRDAAEATLERIAAADDAEFDQQYLEGQVELNLKAQETIATALRPSAEAPELQEHLADAHADVTRHLEQARELHPEAEQVALR